MHISYEPVAFGAAITTGNIGQLADHAAQARENIAKLDDHAELCLGLRCDRLFGGEQYIGDASLACRNRRVRRGSPVTFASRSMLC